MSINSINIIWGWDWMSPPLFAIDLPWIPWVGLPWGCPIITIVRPIYIKVYCRRNLPHYITATLSTLHFSPPHGTRTRLRITRQDEVQIWRVAQFRAHFPIRSGLTSTSLPTRWNSSFFYRSSQLSCLLLRRDNDLSGKCFSWMIKRIWKWCENSRLLILEVTQNNFNL